MPTDQLKWTSDGIEINSKSTDEKTNFDIFIFENEERWITKK